MALMKYFKHIEPSKEKRIQSVLPKPNSPLACLMLTLLSSAIETLIAGAVYETKQSSVDGWVSMYAFIHLKLYDKA